MPLRNLVYSVVSPVLGAAARSRWLIRRLFGVQIPRHLTVHFDPTTLLLYRALRDTVAPEDGLALEVGVGQGALIALALRKSTPLELHGVDCSAERIASSREVAAYNRLPIQLSVSDLFSQVSRDRLYDLIYFNPPYVPTEQGRQLKLTRRMRADHDGVWDGGADGTQVLRTFLDQAAGFLSPRGRLLFGVQPIFVSDGTIQALIAETRFRLLTQYARWPIPSRVYVLQARRD